MPYLNALFFRMITATNISPHQKTPLATQYIRRHPQKIIAPSQKSQPLPPKRQAPSPTKHQHILPQSYVRPQNTGYVSKNTATSTQNQTRVLSKHHHIINNLRLFPQKHTFSACITEKCNTEYSTEHKIQGEQTGIKRTDPYTALIASAPFPMRPRKKAQYPYVGQICQTGITKKTDFSADPLQFFN